MFPKEAVSLPPETEKYDAANSGRVIQNTTYKNRINERKSIYSLHAAGHFI